MFARAVVVAGLAALAAAQSASLGFTRVPTPVTVGRAETISYKTDDSSSPVTILLRQGPSGNLQTVATLTENATGGEYKWTPSSDLASGSDYALQIKQGDQVNYYGPFTINGGSAYGSPSSMSSSHAMSASGYPSSSSHRVTISASRNATSSMTGIASMGTGMPVSRNTTMSRPTLTSSSSASATNEASSQPSDSGAGFQGSQTGSPAASSTGGAAMLTTGGSVVALVFGAVAAAVFA